MLTLTSGTRLKINGESFSFLFILGGITVSDDCQLDRIVNQQADGAPEFWGVLS